jgi:hypothetical protein
MKKLLRIFFPLLAAILISFTSIGQTKITLTKEFIKKYKDRVGIQCNFNVAHAHDRPNSAASDGDLHFAGISNEEIKLAIVAEIMNAKGEPDAVKIVHDVEGTSTKIKIEGVWRIWCEHAGGAQDQNKTFPFSKIKDTNPDHVFEIHPITKVKNEDVIKSLKPIAGFKYKEAGAAFGRYEGTRCKIKPAGSSVEITTNMVGYNYVEFWIEPSESDQETVSDGRFVYCRVLDKHNEVVCDRVRMVFPKNSATERKVKDLGFGEQMHVVGVPRISLAIVDERINSSDPDALDLNLPFEMIVVGVFAR